MEADFRGFSVGPVPAARSDLGARKVIAWSAQPFGTNAYVRAWVGEQELVGITVDQFGLSFEGFVEDVPDPDDTLKVQIDGGEKIDTELTAEGESGVG